MASSPVETDEYYQALPSSVAIHKDHFVLASGEELAAHGLPLLLDLGLQPYWL